MSELCNVKTVCSLSFCTHRRDKSSGDESHTYTHKHTVGLIGESKVSDKYTSAGCGSLPLSLDTCSPGHLLDPAAGPVSRWIMCPSDISAKMTLIYTWSLFLEHRQNIAAEKALSFLSVFFQKHIVWCIFSCSFQVQKGKKKIKNT